MTNPEHSPNPPEASFTAEQLALLESGPGLVTDPAAANLITAEDALARPGNFYPHLGNFKGYFAPSGGLYASFSHAMVWRQRFAILYPDQTKWLEKNFDILWFKNPDSTEDAPEILAHSRLIDAYKLMHALVDKRDATVVNNDGLVDPDFLLR